MKTILFVSLVFYSVMLTLCVYYVASFIAFAMNHGHKAELPVRILTAAGVVAVTLYFMISRRLLSGHYAVYIAFVISPATLSDFACGNGKFRLVPAVIIETVAAIFIVLSCICPVKASLPTATVILMAALLVLLIGHTIWILSGRTRRFDGMVSAREAVGGMEDIFYFAVLVLLLCLGKAMGGQPGWWQSAGSVVCVALMAGLVEAQDLRRKGDRMFLICKGRDNMMNEAYRMERNSPVSGTKMNSSYENLFIRLNEYFDRERPYLDANMTLTSAAKDLLTNKQYLSMTVNVYTGKNFCQFVNYHRIKYIMENYREEEGMKLSEYALKCGFRTVHSFTVSFRLNMNVSPTRWSHRGKELK